MYNLGFDGLFYDTGIPTSELDEVTMGAGMYDEMYVTVDDETTSEPTKPDQWTLKTIMDANFNNTLEAGSINGRRHHVVKLQMYRREYENPASDWLLISEFSYEEKYNLYTVIDRFVENYKTYEYALVPLAKDITGEMLISKPVQAKFTGTFISDVQHNYSMFINLQFSDLTYNNNVSKVVPLNGKYPIVTYGNANYRTGSVKFLPLTPEQEFGYASEIDSHAEFDNRKKIIDFLSNGQAKVIRRDDGDVIVVATNNVRTESISESVDELSNVTFDFTEIGGLDYSTLEKGGLISNAGKSVYTYDDTGNIVWNSERINDGARRRNADSLIAGSQEG
ncbi:hypothetical protein [Limosilactobacillus reuteri]|nr:hypothetical protein [Limosilactobacillus reuteri]